MSGRFCGSAPIAIAWGHDWMCGASASRRYRTAVAMRSLTDRDARSVDSRRTLMATLQRRMKSWTSSTGPRGNMPWATDGKLHGAEADGEEQRRAVKAQANSSHDALRSWCLMIASPMRQRYSPTVTRTGSEGLLSPSAIRGIASDELMSVRKLRRRYGASARTSAQQHWLTLRAQRAAEQPQESGDVDQQSQHSRPPLHSVLSPAALTLV